MPCLIPLNETNYSFLLCWELKDLLSLLEAEARLGARQTCQYSMELHYNAFGGRLRQILSWLVR
jgi:hypothetical protein